MFWSLSDPRGLHLCGDTGMSPPGPGAVTAGALPSSAFSQKQGHRTGIRRRGSLNYNLLQLNIASWDHRTRKRSHSQKSGDHSVKSCVDGRNTLGALVGYYGMLQRGFPDAHNELTD